MPPSLTVSRFGCDGGGYLRFPLSHPAYEQIINGTSSRRLTSGQDFTWPLAPGLSGGVIDLRQTPDNRIFSITQHSLGSEASLGVGHRDQHEKHLLLGYLFRRVEYPWLQYWGNYPPTHKFSRGMEFGTQPFDVSRREAVSTGEMFGTPTYRWLPAKSKINSRFVVFYTRVPRVRQSRRRAH